MERDGYLRSLWQGIPAYQPVNFATGNNLYDVVIAGGGITGLTTALKLQKAGKKCLLLEAQNIGFGTTGGTTAHLNTMLDTPYNTIAKNFGEESAQMICTLARQSIELIKRNIQEYYIECEFEEQPGYLFAADEAQEKELPAIYEASKKAGVEIDWSNEIPVPIPFIKAAKFEKQASFHPGKYITALAAAFESAGGIIIQQCRVTSVDENDIIKVICSNNEVYQANHFIYATHVPPGVNLLHFRCAPYRSYALALKLKDDQYPSGLVYDMHDPYHYYRTQVVDGEKYLIAGGEDHKTGHEENTLTCFNKLESYCRKYFNVEQVAYKWSSQYFESADGLPYIGRLPGHSDNMYVATGFGGNGIIYGTAASILLTEMIASDNGEAYAELLDPSRIKMVAGFNNFVKESADVVGQLISKLLPADKLNDFSELAAGDSKVINYDHHTVAVHKDDSGQLHALNAACTHIKCNVAWNSAEKSWDCPCHGSRFSIDGTMLTAPARKNMEKINLR